jgi:hypothetical protein
MRVKGRKNSKDVSSFGFQVPGRKNWVGEGVKGVEKVEGVKDVKEVERVEEVRKIGHFQFPHISGPFRILNLFHF